MATFQEFVSEPGSPGRSSFAGGQRLSQPLSRLSIPMSPGRGSRASAVVPRPGGATPLNRASKVRKSSIAAGGARASMAGRTSVVRKSGGAGMGHKMGVAGAQAELMAEQDQRLSMMRQGSLSAFETGDGAEYFQSGLGTRIKGMLKSVFEPRSVKTKYEPKRNEETVRFRRWLQKYLAVSPLGYLIDLTNILLSGMSCAMYMWETYQPELAETLSLVDVFFGAFFLFDYMLRLYLADQRLRYATTFMALIDLITILPVAFYFVNLSEELAVYTSLVRVLRVLRIVRINRFILSTMDSEVSRQVTLLSTTIITTGFFAAGVVQIFENSHRQFHMMNTIDFHEAIYFVIVTISTVGYGDISPASTEARGVVSILICAALVYIPKATNHLLVLMSTKSIYARKSYKPPPHTAFVLVCGSLDVVGARAFLTELFHEDHGNIDLHAVLLCEKLPSSGMENLLSSSAFVVNVTYLQGSPLDINDLVRANVLNASACFLLCNKFTSDPNREDAATILRALSIKRFYLQMRGDDILTCVQLMRQENKQHFTLSHQIMMKDLYIGPVAVEEPSNNPLHALHLPSSTARRNSLITPIESATGDGPQMERQLSAGSLLESMSSNDGSKKAKEDPIICVNEIKMNLLAQACLCPGIITMIGNLVMSVDAPEEEAGASDMTNKQKTMRNLGDTDSAGLWMREYKEGSEFEIYRTRLSKVFERVPFAVAASLVHKHLGALIFSLELSVGSYSRVVMNPGKFLIPEIDAFDVHCFVIATDLDSADLSSLDDHLYMPMNGSGGGKRGGSFVLSGSASFGRRRGPETFADRLHKLAKEMRAAKLDPHKDFDNKRASEVKMPPTKRGESPKETGARAWGIVKNSLHHSPPRTQRGAQQKQAPEFAANPKGSASLDPQDSEEKEQFFLLNESKSLEAVTVEDSLIKDFPEINEHIVICGNLSGLVSLVRTLRARHLASVLPIVILNPEPPNHSLWVQISRFPFIFYVQGSSTDRSDLIRAGIRFASRAIVLARSVGSSSDVKDETMSDAHAIFAHQGAIGLNPEIQIVTELINVSNVGFLDVGGTSRASKNPDAQQTRRSQGKMSLAGAVSYHNALQFIAGVVFSSSMLDTLISQSFYNPHITTVFQQLISGAGTSKVAEDGPEQFESAEEQLQYERVTFAQDVKQSHLFQIPVPKELSGKTYRELFDELVDSWGMVPLGLLRGVQSPLSSFFMGNAIPYVFTNPPGETVVAFRDKVFVLSKSAPSTKLAGKSVTDVLKEVSTMSRQEEMNFQKAYLNSSRSNGMPSASARSGDATAWIGNEIRELKRSIEEIKQAINKKSQQRHSGHRRASADHAKAESTGPPPSPDDSEAGSPASNDGERRRDSIDLDELLKDTTQVGHELDSIHKTIRESAVMEDADRGVADLAAGGAADESMKRRVASIGNSLGLSESFKSRELGSNASTRSFGTSHSALESTAESTAESDEPGAAA